MNVEAVFLSFFSVLKAMFETKKIRKEGLIKPPSFHGLTYLIKLLIFITFEGVQARFTAEYLGANTMQLIINKRSY